MQKKKKTFKDTLSELLELSLKDEGEFDIIKGKEELTVGEAIAIAQIKKALTGDYKAYEAIKETLSVKKEGKTSDARQAKEEKALIEKLVSQLCGEEY